MRTCKYCGTKLDFVGELNVAVYFHCSHCDITFDLNETCLNRKRKKSVSAAYDDNYYRSTKELLKTNTIELFHLLHDCRKDWYETYKLLSNLINMKNITEIPSEIDAAFKPLYNEYVCLTKQKFVIENIILEKAGFLPEKITIEFLNNLIEQGETASEKPMYIYIKK